MDTLLRPHAVMVEYYNNEVGIRYTTSLDTSLDGTISEYLPDANLHSDFRGLSRHRIGVGALCQTRDFTHKSNTHV
jgi:hypothetical protein